VSDALTHNYLLHVSNVKTKLTNYPFLMNKKPIPQIDCIRAKTQSKRKEPKVTGFTILSNAFPGLKGTANQRKGKTSNFPKEERH